MFQREIDQVEIDALQQHVRGEQQITFSGIYYSGIVPGAQHRGCVTYGKLAGKPLYQSELSELGYLRSFRRHIFCLSFVPRLSDQFVGAAAGWYLYLFSGSAFHKVTLFLVWWKIWLILSAVNLITTKSQPYDKHSLVRPSRSREGNPGEDAE